jgi:ribosome-binding factor A
VPTARTLRLNELLQRELSGLLHQEFQAETVTITVTSVDVAPDLRSCKIFVAVTGDDEQAEDRLRWLRRHAAALRTTLSHRIVLKHLPALTFLPDTATLRGNRILAVLDEIAAKENPARVGRPGPGEAGLSPDDTDDQ